MARLFPKAPMIVKIEWSQERILCPPIWGGGHPKIGSVHREGFQETPTDEWMGMRPSFSMTRRMIRSSLSGAIAHSGRRSVCRAMCLCEGKRPCFYELPPKIRR